METSELVVTFTNSKGIERGLSDTSLWSFLDVSLSALCQTLLRVSRTTAPTHQPKTITHTRRMSRMKSVKSAKCQVDMMAEFGSKSASHWTNSCGNSTETLQSPYNLLNEKAFEHLQPQKNTAALGERYPSKHGSKSTVVVQQSSREIGASPTEHHRGKTVGVNKRHAMNLTANVTHTAHETSAAEDKQMAAARTHAHTSSSKVDNGYVLDANTGRNINHTVLPNEEANSKHFNKDTAVEEPSENHEMEKEMDEFRCNDETWALTERSNTNERHRKEETYAKAKPIKSGHDRLLKVNTVEVCTPDMPFGKTVIQNESENGGRINRYEVSVTPLKHIDTNKAFNTDVGENSEQKRTKMHDTEGGSTFQENIHKNEERGDILECKNTRKAIKDQEEMHKNKEGRTYKMTQLLEIEQEGQINCNISDDEWNEDHENFSNYIKTSRSLMKNSRSHKKPNRPQRNKIEEQDNYDNSMMNKMAITWTSAQEDQNTFVNYTLDAKDSREQNSSLISFNNIASQADCENSANQKVELDKEWLQDLKDKKLRMNTNGYRYMNQRPTKEFHVITTDGHSKENSDEDTVPNTLQTNSPFTNTNHKTELASSHSLLRTDNVDRIMAECTTMVQHKDTVENSDNMASWLPKCDVDEARMKSKDDGRSEKLVTSTATGLKSLKQQVFNLNETDKCRKNEVKQSTECNENFANTSYSDEQGHSKAEAQLILTTKKAENQPDNDKIEATAAVETNFEENELDVNKYKKEVKKHKKAPSICEDNFSTNEINTLGALRYNESKGMSEKRCNTVGQDETRCDKGMFHLDSITIPENASISQNKRTFDSSMEDTAQEIDSLNITNIIDPENAYSHANVQFMLSQYAQKTEDHNTCRNKTASKTAGLALCSNASSKQMQDTYRSSKSKDIEGYTSARGASTECRTMAPLAAICSTDEKANLPQIPTKANDHQSEVNLSDDSSFLQAMSQTETRPKRRYSSADRKISQGDVFLYSVLGSKRRSRSESLTRRRTLSREWQMLTITTTEETTIIAGTPKTKVHKQIQENAVLHEKEQENSRSFNLQLNTDKLQNNPMRRLGVANELQPTTFQTLSNLINTCKTESETCVVESTKPKGTEPRSNSYGKVSSEAAATLNPATQCLVNSDKKLEEIHICASLLSHVEMHSMDNTTNSSVFQGQITNKEHELVGNEIVTDSKYIYDDNKQVDQTETKETEVIVESTCMMETSPKIPYNFSNYIQPYQNVPNENEYLFKRSAINVKTKEETQEKKISTGIADDFQTNGSCKQKSVEIRSRQSPSQYASEISPSHEVSKILKLKDAAIQCTGNLAEYREAITQTDYDILTQGEEANQRFRESKSSDLLMFPTLQLTYVKPSDTSKRSFAINEGNKSTIQIPEVTRKKSNFTQGNATNGHIFSQREFKNDGLEKKFVGYTWHCKGVRNGTSVKTVRQKGIHRSNSLDDFCTILSTCVISEQFDSLVNHGETLIILKLLNKD